MTLNKCITWRSKDYYYYFYTQNVRKRRKERKKEWVSVYKWLDKLIAWFTWKFYHHYSYTQNFKKRRDERVIDCVWMPLNKWIT